MDKNLDASNTFSDSCKCFKCENMTYSDLLNKLTDIQTLCYNIKLTMKNHRTVIGITE